MDVIGKSLYVYLSRLEGDIKDIYCDLIPPKNRIEDYPCALKLSSMDDVDIVKELLRSIVKDIWVSKNETYL